VYRNPPEELSQFDIILCQFGYRGADFARLLRFIPTHKRPKLVTCFRGADISKFIQRNPHCYDTLFIVGDLFLPVCSFFKRQLIKLGCPKEKIAVLHSGIDCKAFEFKPKNLHPSEPIIVTSVCRLVEKKGIEYVINAIAQLVPRYPTIEYWIIGDGPLKEHLYKHAWMLNIADKVFFWGRQPEQSVIEILHKSHIFILPSVKAKSGDLEGIPNALKEAMACGVPVIATYHGGNEELIRENMGTLIPEKKISAIVESIIHCIETYGTKKMYAQLHAAQAYVRKEFSMISLNKKLHNTLLALVHPMQ
jgi:colanic acid/amylovoran biosynthesis glycosyltransferase